MWPFGSVPHASLSLRGLRRLPPLGHASRALPLLAIKVEPPVFSAPTQTPVAMVEDVLDPDLAERALGQFLVSPEPHDLYETPHHDVFEIVSCKLVSRAEVSAGSPLSISDLPMASLSPMGDGDEYLSDWFDRRSDAGELEEDADSDRYNGQEPSPSPVPAIEKSELKIDQSLDRPHSIQITPDKDDKAQLAAKGDDKERLRRRQRQYEKKYRSRKRDDIKKMRREWLEKEVLLLAARRARLEENVVTLPQHTLEALEPWSPVLGGRAELLRRCRCLARLERALLLDRMALSAFGAFDKVARIREYTDKEELLTRREWQHSTNKIFGENASQAPHQLLPLSFTW